MTPAEESSDKVNQHADHHTQNKSIHRGSCGSANWRSIPNLALRSLRTAAWLLGFFGSLGIGTSTPSGNLANSSCHAGNGLDLRHGICGYPRIKITRHEKWKVWWLL